MDLMAHILLLKRIFMSFNETPFLVFASRCIIIIILYKRECMYMQCILCIHSFPPFICCCVSERDRDSNRGSVFLYVCHTHAFFKSKT